MNKKLGVRRGFTLVEITLIVGILVVLSAIVLVALNIRGNSATANNVKRKIDLEQIQKALDLRAQETGDPLPSGLSSGLSERCVGTGSDAYNLSNISWTESSGDPDIKFDVRSCDDAGCVGEAWPGAPTFSFSPATLNITNAPYFQYKATFNASENSWSQPSDEPFNGTNASTTISGVGSSSKVQLNSNTNPGAGSNGARVYCASGKIIGVDVFDGSTCTYAGNQTLVTQAAAFNFTDFKIESTVIVTVSGANPLQINTTGDVNIAGTLNLNGSPGGNGNYAASPTPGTAGAGVAGGAIGGTGGGASGGNGGSVGGYSGGGFGSTGGGGGASYGSDGVSSGGSKGTIYPPGDNTLTNLLGGSGGGGGGNGDQTSGGGGGGGGGAIKITTNKNITVSGMINAKGGKGGNGGSRTNSTGGDGGGGGSGGAIFLQGATLNITGVINASSDGGGTGSNNSTNGQAGGAGGNGRIRLDSATQDYSQLSAFYANINPDPGYTICTFGCDGWVTYLPSGTYTSLSHDLNQQQTFTSISWNRSDSNDGEITLGDADLKGLWHFNETAGTNAADSTIANNLTITSATQSSPGKFGGRSLSFNGSAYAQKTSPTNLEIGASDGGWTMEAWVKPTGTAAGTIISKDGVGMHYYNLKLDANNKVIAGLYDYNPVSGLYDDQAVAQSNTALISGNWYYIAAIFTKSGATGNIQIYINGIKDGQGSNSALPFDMSNTAAFRIGMRNEGTLGFNGEIDEVALWSKALSAPVSDCATDESKISYDSYQYEICQHYNKGVGVPHLKFQAKSCNDAACDAEVFVGPDGTSSTYYNSIGNYGTGSALNLPNNQWVQYKANFATSDSSKTPSLDAISIKYLSTAKPQLLDATISGISTAFGNSGNFTHTTYNNFIGGIFNSSEFTIRDSTNPSDSVSGLVEYKGGIGVNYASPIFSGNCYNLAPDLAPLYLGSIPKDPKIGTDQNTGYLISVDPATKVVCVKAPGAENNEIIENCRK